MFFKRYRSLDCCTALSGKAFLQFLLLCYNRTDMFLETGLFFLTTTIVMEVSFVLFVGFVILLIKLSERLTRISLFFPLFFHSLWSDLFYKVDVCTFCWMLTLFDILFDIVFIHRVVITVRAFG